MRSSGLYDALGTTFEMRAGARLGRMLADALADLSVETSDETHHVVQVSRQGFKGWTVRRDGDVHVEGVDPSTALDEVMTVIDDLATASAAATDTVLRAGAVEIDGQAVAFIGRPRLVEPTLVAAAVHRHSYIANQVLAVDPNWRARPFHAPVTNRGSIAEALGLTRSRTGYPVHLGGRVPLSDGAPLGLVVLLEETDTGVSLEPLSQPFALTRLANQAVGAVSRERVMFQRLEQLVRRFPVVSMSTGAIDDMIAVLRDVMRQA